MTSRSGRALTQKFKQIGMYPETGYVMWRRGRGPWEQLPPEVTHNYEFVETKKQGRMYFNEEGLVHRVGEPALEHKNGVKEWWVKGKSHRLDGPAIESPNGNSWWVNNIESERPDLCEKAVQLNLTDEEFYQLCSHEDYVVRQIAANNPNCPDEWRTLACLKDNTDEVSYVR